MKKMNFIKKIRSDSKFEKYEYGYFETEGKEILEKKGPQKPKKNTYGVYIILDKNDNVLYIGKSGTMEKDGTFKGWDLSKRMLQKTGKGKTAQIFNDFFYPAYANNAPAHRRGEARLALNVPPRPQPPRTHQKK